jgi:hypothetical protein
MEDNTGTTFKVIPIYVCRRDTVMFVNYIHHHIHQHRPSDSGSPTPKLTRKHPRALATHHTNPPPHDGRVQPASYYSRLSHRRPRPGPKVAAHTPRVLSQRLHEVASGRRSAQCNCNEHEVQRQVALLKPWATTSIGGSATHGLDVSTDARREQGCYILDISDGAESV